MKVWLHDLSSKYRNMSITNWPTCGEWFERFVRGDRA